jgi:hypothetical protein
MNFLGTFVVIATATLCDSAPQWAAGDYFFFSAIASTQPHGLSTPVVFSTFQNNQPTKSLARQIDNSGH